ncbi:MAG: rRNA maturation RNase YbeY [Parachlamydiaceae bacterium]
MIVNVMNEQEALKIDPLQVERLVQKVIEFEGQSCAEVNIYFVDTPTICDLHAQFFNDPTPTDCISFPMDEENERPEERLMGEVFVCPATAIEYAIRHKKNVYTETSLYIIHGLLHLMGYDDIEEEEIVVMRKAEERHITLLQSLNLLIQPINNDE